MHKNIIRRDITIDKSHIDATFKVINNIYCNDDDLIKADYLNKNLLFCRMEKTKFNLKLKDKVDGKTIKEQINKILKENSCFYNLKLDENFEYNRLDKTEGFFYIFVLTQKAKKDYDLDFLEFFKMQASNIKDGKIKSKAIKKSEIKKILKHINNEIDRIKQKDDDQYIDIGMSIDENLYNEIMYKIYPIYIDLNKSKKLENKAKEFSNRYRESLESLINSINS